MHLAFHLFAWCARARPLAYSLFPFIFAISFGFAKSALVMCSRCCLPKFLFFPQSSSPAAKEERSATCTHIHCTFFALYFSFSSSSSCSVPILFIRFDASLVSLSLSRFGFLSIFLLSRILLRCERVRWRVVAVAVIRPKGEHNFKIKSNIFTLKCATRWRHLKSNENPYQTLSFFLALALARSNSNHTHVQRTIELQTACNLFNPVSCKTANSMVFSLWDNDRTSFAYFSSSSSCFVHTIQRHTCVDVHVPFSCVHCSGSRKFCDGFAADDSKLLYKLRFYSVVLCLSLSFATNWPNVSDRVCLFLFCSHCPCVLRVFVLIIFCRYTVRIHSCDYCRFDLITRALASLHSYTFTFVSKLM